MKEIITRGLNRAEVLLTLYNHAITDETVFKEKGTLNRAMYESTYDSIFERINLGAGFRIINVNLENFELFDATFYDNAHGEGQAAKAIAALQKQEPEILPSLTKKRKMQS